MKGFILRFKKEEFKSPKPTGFDMFRLPPAEYILDCIYTLKPTHEIF